MSEENGLLSQAPGSEPPLRGEQPLTRHRGREVHTVGVVHVDGSGPAESRGHGDGRMRAEGRARVDGGGGCADADAHADAGAHIGGSREVDGNGRAAHRRTGRAGGRSGGAGVRLAVRAAHAVERAEATSEVHRFADRSLRAVLEVLDRRRKVEQLAGVADPLVLAAVRTLVSAGPAPERALGSAVLVRIDVRLLAADTAELCAGYNRGERRFALAARAVRRRATGWRLTALRVR
ncbi:Rv3235 family protein [Nocardia shimofusensis]|uniref:Rv3235 family protein n=1 Tax=Nocardia shimofusensis TaxID=228596 RepID=UPI0012ECEA11|nr:Rv3235 family protein [Nocardia shimofusensis]